MHCESLLGLRAKRRHRLVNATLELSQDERYFDGSDKLHCAAQGRVSRQRMTMTMTAAQACPKEFTRKMHKDSLDNTWRY